MTEDELERLRPTDGARFLFELADVEDAGARARYRAWVLTPDATCAYQAVLAEDGGHELHALGGAAPDELAAMLAQLAKLTARASAGKRADGLPPWPPRILRWRGPGR